MGLVDKIKKDVQRAGTNKGKFCFVRDGQKIRIRFLTDMDDGQEVVFHDSYTRGINVPCKEAYGKECPYCDDEELRTRSQYVWSVYDYESKAVKLFMFPVNNCSPVPALIAMYENYGTLLDRDYIISVSGKQTEKTYSVVPMDKEKFRNEKAKPYSKKKILDIISKSYPWDEDEDEDEYEKPRKSNKSSKSDSYDDWDEEDEDDSDIDYSDMTAKELFKLCKERDIDALPKKKEKYYINLLEEYDKAQDDWDEDEEDDEDEWEDE